MRRAFDLDQVAFSIGIEWENEQWEKAKAKAKLKR